MSVKGRNSLWHPPQISLATLSLVIYYIILGSKLYFLPFARIPLLFLLFFYLADRLLYSTLKLFVVSLTHLCIACPGWKSVLLQKKSSNFFPMYRYGALHTSFFLLLFMLFKYWVLLSPSQQETVNIPFAFFFHYIVNPVQFLKNYAFILF